MASTETGTTTTPDTSTIPVKTGQWWKGVPMLEEPVEFRPAAGGAFEGRVRSSKEIIPGVPALSDEAIGWFAHLSRKVGFGGTWHKEDEPHESWDDISFSPPLNFRRYDLTWASWSIAQMAETTPAWREGYSKVLGFMAERYLEYWANYEWLEHRGHDESNRADYPDSFLPFLPPDLIGKYDVVGWAGNGGGGFEYDPDPVRGSGQNMMYKGYLNLAISLYGYVSGDDRFDRPFEVVYDEDWKFEYDHRALNEMIAEQWRGSWPGIACEAGKIFPWCNNLGGTAVKIFDATHGTDCFVPYENYKRFAKEHYLLDSKGTGRIDRVTHYHDPNIDFYANAPELQLSVNVSPITWHGLGLDRPLFERVYEGMMDNFWREQPDGTAFLAALPGLDVDINAGTGLGAACALELGDMERYSALRGFMEANYEPTWDAEHGEFAFGFGLDEAWPRGQYNGWVMPAFAGAPGRWQGLTQSPNVAKFTEPTLEDIDYPVVRVRQAYYDRDERTLSVSVTHFDPATLGRPTEFTISNLFDEATYAFILDGQRMSDVEVNDGRARIVTTVGPHTLRVHRI